MAGRLVLFACVLSAHIPSVTGNCEKVIFRAPPTQPSPPPPDSLDLALSRLDVLTPSDRPSVRTHIDSAFPTAELPHGETSWFLLDRLTERALYDVRLCWSAVQPTIFKLDLFDLPTLLQETDLLSSLVEYSASRAGLGLAGRSTSTRETEPTSLQFLRVLAETEYYASNASLMTNVPPVHADIILDVYHFGVLPRSLVPVAGYIALVVLVSWLVSRRVLTWIHAFALATGEPGPQEKARKQQ